MDRTYADLFTGFGGATIGAIAAGLTPLWGVELDAKIAAVANQNVGGHVHVANILDIDPHTLPRVDVLHASPPCPNFSVAKANGTETALDLDLARKVAQFVTVLQPQTFTLENVYAYRQSQSWLTIQDALFNAGYWVSIEHVNAADFSVPQTRQRMIVRAVRGGWVPYLPEPVRWVGWYEAIEDLLPGLPDSQFAPWQLKRLPAELRTCLVAQGGYDGAIVTTPEDAPANTVTANSNQMGLRAFLINVMNTTRESTSRTETEPAFTITGSVASRPSHTRAFIVDCQKAGSTTGERSLTIRGNDEPMYTLTASMFPKRPPRAFLVGKTADKFGDGIRQHDEPAQTIKANEHGSKAFTHGRVVAMSARCLARFQSFPDSYILPESKTLAAKGIGNAVAPLMYQRILEGLPRG